MDPIGDYKPPEDEDGTSETTLTDSTFDDATTYNTSDNSSLSSDARFTSQEVPVSTIDEVHKTISDLYSRDKWGELENVKLNYLRKPKFTDGTKWRFTLTNRVELAEYVFTYGEIIDLIRHLKPDYNTAGVTAPYFEQNINQLNSLYMIGKDRGGKLHWVRITDTRGKLLSRSTIEGKRGGKLVADQLSELSHYYESTGLRADLRRKKENEEAAKEEKRIEDTAFMHNIESKEKGDNLMAKFFDPNESKLGEETGEQIELQEQTQLPVRRPTPQQSNTTTFIKDVINKDAKIISSGSTTQLPGDITPELQDLIPGSRRQIALSEINNLLDTPQDVLESVGFNELLLRDVRTFKAMSDPIAKAVVRIVNKIQLLDEQLDKETDPEKKREIEKLMDVEKRNLKSLQSEDFKELNDE